MFDQWNAHTEGRTNAYFGFKSQFTSMLLYDDVVSNCQALTGALPHRFRRKEWIEDSIANGFGYTGTSIGDFNHYPIAIEGRTNGQQPQFLRAHLARAFDRMSRVRDQVQQSLIQIARQAGNQRQAGIELSDPSRSGTSRRSWKPAMYFRQPG